MAELWIANTVRGLIQGDVLGLGTTTSIDNGELSFLQQPGDGDTTIWKCQASDGGIRGGSGRHGGTGGAAAAGVGGRGDWPAACQRHPAWGTNW